MKKGIIAISLLLTGALLVTPITNAVSELDVAQTTSAPAKAEQVVKNEKVEVTDKNNDKTAQTNDIDNEKTPVKEVMIEEETTKEAVIQQETAEEVINTKDDIKEETIVKEENTVDEEKEDATMSKEEAEAVLNKYIKDVEEGDFTYTYQGDENTFEAIKEKGIKGYVFLPNIETDMAYLVDKDSGNIYLFHPSGYFELLQ